MIKPPKTLDSTLDERVNTAINASPYVSKGKLRFETHQGRVTLRGEVGSYFHKQMAQETLKPVHGVEEIENLLEVNWH